LKLEHSASNECTEQMDCGRANCYGFIAQLYNVFGGTLNIAQLDSHMGGVWI